MSEHPRIHYEFTIDESVDFQIAFIRSTREGSGWRRRELRKFSIVLPLSMAGTFFLFTATDETPIRRGEIILIGVLAVVLCPLAALAFARYYDGVVRRRTRRLLVEHFGGEGPHPCTIEVLPDALRVELQSVEQRFPWSAATSLEETPEGIVLKFTGGGAIVPDRAFASPGERAAFLQRVREIAPSRVSSTRQGPQ